MNLYRKSLNWDVSLILRGRTEAQNSNSGICRSDFEHLQHGRKFNPHVDEFAKMSLDIDYSSNMYLHICQGGSSSSGSQRATAARRDRQSSSSTKLAAI